MRFVYLCVTGLCLRGLQIDYRGLQYTICWMPISNLSVRAGRAQHFRDARQGTAFLRSHRPTAVQLSILLESVCSSECQDASVNPAHMRFQIRRSYSGVARGGSGWGDAAFGAPPQTPGRLHRKNAGSGAEPPAAFLRRSHPRGLLWNPNSLLT